VENKDGPPAPIRAHAHLCDIGGSETPDQREDQSATASSLYILGYPVCDPVATRN